MNVTEKVELIEAVAGEYGVCKPCELLELNRSTLYARRRQVPYEVKYQHLREPLETIARAAGSRVSSCLIASEPPIPSVIVRSMTTAT